MARQRRQQAPEALSPAAKAGQPADAPPTAVVGRNDRGAVRPSDDRFLEDAELDDRDAYLLEVTGPDAQQLVAKREAMRLRLDRLTDSELFALVPEGFDGPRADLVAKLTGSVTEMPNATYRELLATLDEALADQEEDEF